MQCSVNWTQCLVNLACCCYVASVMSDSVQPHRWQPTRLCRPWESPGKNTGVGCHFLLQCMKVESEKWKWSRSVVSDSSKPRGLQATRLLCPWEFPGKSTGVGCHCLLQHYNSKVSTFWHSCFLMVQLSHLHMIIGKSIALTRWIFVNKIMSLLFNMLSRFVSWL